MPKDKSILVCGPLDAGTEAVITDVLSSAGANCRFCTYAEAEALLAGDARCDMLVTLPVDVTPARFDEIDIAVWERGLDDNLHARFRVAQAAVQKFAASKAGVIVHVVPAAGLIGQAEGGTVSIATMSGVALSRSIALDNANTGIVSNVIATRGPDHARSLAALIGFLGSGEGQAISGQVYAVDGDEIHISSQPRPIRVAHRDGGWDQANLARVIGTAWGEALLPADAGIAEVFGA